MRLEALFLNGIYEDVLQEILQIQETLSEHIMFLQPYKSEAIVRLRDEPPSVDDPVRLLMSLTSDLATVHYTAEIVGWDDKRNLPEQKRRVLSRLICTLQPNEGGLYDESRVEGGESVNLLHVRRLRQLVKPFGVSQLLKFGDNEPVSDKRTTAGGWVYVKTEKLAALIV
jgi:5-methylcytosine-specific restriction enzyme A